MSRDYATDAQVASALPEYDPNDDTQAARVAELIDRATDLIDAELPPWGGATQMFEQPTGTPAARTYYGIGTAFLRIHRVADLTTVAADGVVPADGSDAPTFAHVGSYLILADSSGRRLDRAGSSAVWREGAAYAVTADWGYTEVPGDIQQACVAIVAEWWRRRRAAYDANFPQVETQVGGVGNIPPEARETLDRYRATQAFVTAF